MAEPPPGHRRDAGRAARGGRAGGRPALVLRRASTQVPLLAAVLAVVVAGTTLLGTCVLLLTTAQDRALEQAIARAGPAEVDVTVGLRLAVPDAGDGAPDASDPPAVDAAQVVADATALVEDAFAPAPSSTSVWLASALQYLPATAADTLRLGYLLDAPGLEAAATLAAGRWPAPTATAADREVAVLTSTARALDLAPGDRVVLSPDPQHASEQADGASSPGSTEVGVVVVGTFTRAHDQDGAQGAWERDPLDGEGVDTSTGLIPAYGPFVVAPGTLPATEVPVGRVSLVVRPDLSDADADELVAMGPPSGSLRTDLTRTLGDAVSSTAVASPYPRTLADARTQQGITSSGVLVVALLGAALAATALGLAARLVAVRRAAEATLLVARGARRGQLVRQAAAESALLAALAAAAGVPLSLVTFRAVTALPWLAGAGLAGPASVTAPLVVAVASAALLLAALLVAPSVRPVDAGAHRRPRRGLVARSGTDVVLAAVAVAAYVQLRAHRVATGAEPDPVLVAAPLLVLLAGAVLVLRVLPWVSRLAEGHARASRGLVLPLAAWEVSRRPHSTAGAFLLILATAAATFGVSFTSTWWDSQADQAEAEVGTELVVDVTGAPVLAQGAAVAVATGGDVSPVTRRAIALGSRVGGGTEESTTQLLAVDTRRADALMRGRLPEGSWADVSAGLAPTTGGAGPLVPAAPTLDVTVTGAADDGTPLETVPGLLVEDAWGSRTLVVAATPVPLDGQPHTVPVPVGAVDGDPEVRVVGVELPLTLLAPQDVPWQSDITARVTATVDVPGAHLDAADALGTAGGWSEGRSPSDFGAVRNARATQAGSDDGVAVTATASVSLTTLLYADAAIVVTALPAAEELPVVVTEPVARELGLGTGAPLSLTVGGTTVEATVVGVAPYLPSVPRGPAVLADHDALSRALVARADLTSMTDTWWVAGLEDPAAAVAAAGDLGPTVTRADVTAELRDGPLRGALRAALWLLVVAAVGLALAGTAVHTATALDARAVEVARLQGLGVSRRSVVASFLAEHSAVTLVVVAAGTGVGAFTGWAVGPLLAVSATGRPPVPAAAFGWPWASQSVLVLGLVLGCAAVVVPVALRTVRRATVAHLRMDAS
ncbi:FtsX-like permease family protein [Actinotalea subterranea]|uniref:FtsX-like permease family protein n=1 Tax=Actinotalea subterranea TaxID=2607497 RepID=UPI0011EF671C|nr:ABC transporter permease [Actinotalea subterranea]